MWWWWRRGFRSTTVVAAERRQLFVNAVDDPPNATAYLGGVVRREGVTVAISTSGRAPALAGLMREALDAWLPADLAEWMAAADEIRATWKRDGVAIDERRPQLLETLNRLYEETPTRSPTPLTPRLPER
jgi:uroporphyrin-III C-methyltransferase/precorrin-2 dehydrogenase/sirohydrochlorin ferrochelatase